MSWDISIMKFSRTYQSVAELSKKEKPLELGSRASIHERVLVEFPGTNWADPAWGIWDSPARSIEFCRANGRQGIDCSSGDFIEQSNEPTRGLESWAAYRDHVVHEK